MLPRAPIVSLTIYLPHYDINKTHTINTAEMEETLLDEETCHPLIKAFGEKIAIEALELAKMNNQWTARGILEEIGIIVGDALGRVHRPRVSGYYVALREEKANAPPEALSGGRAMKGQYAKYVAPLYKLKKEEYDQKAKEERGTAAGTRLKSTKDVHKGLLKLVREDVCAPLQIHTVSLLIAIA